MATTNILETVTPQMFIEYFSRDFPYLPDYVEGKTYWLGDVVYYTDGNFYESLIDDNTTAPTDTTNWQKIKDSVENYVGINDIQKAINEALANANPRFGNTDNEKIMIFMYLAAFYLVVDMQNAAAGLTSNYLGITQAKSVGDVSESYMIPSFISENPMYAIYMQNGYGMKYMSLIAPYLAITVRFSVGRTTFG